MKPGLAFAFFKDVQQSFYYENNMPGDIDTYIALAQKHGLDPKEFHILFNADQSKVDTYAEFELAAKMGVRSFPTLIAKIDNKLYIASSGYQKADRIIKLLRGRGM